jgi:SAM-dependent methyltransferase
VRPTDGLGLGYGRVDDDPGWSHLLANMDATATWEATRELRAWEREHLALRPGERLLDVGCGLGDAALALAAELGSTGEVVGIDASEAMVDEARRRASDVACRTRFSVGDGLALGEPDASFDAARSERMLQWVTDPGAAVAELARVLRPGGRLALIDSDWSTFRLDVGDSAISSAVREAMREERRRPSNVGRRLGTLARAAGLTDVVETSATQVWTSWDPDESPTPIGCFSMSSLADDLVSAGHLDPSDVDALVATVHDAARAGRFRMALSMSAVVAVLP